MSESRQSQKKTQLFVKLVDRAEAKAAHASAEVLSKFGIGLVVFTDREMMIRWLSGVRKIPGLSVRALSELEVPHG